MALRVGAGVMVQENQVRRSCQQELFAIDFKGKAPYVAGGAWEAWVFSPLRSARHR